MESSVFPTNGMGNSHAIVPSTQTDPATCAPSTRVGDARTLPELLTAFETLEAYENPDVVLPLHALRVNEQGLVEVPRAGAFAFTDWSRRQCASRLGLKWDRWFENANNAERSEELNRRLRRATDSVRLRTSRLIESGADAEPGASGTLRAFVTPGYSPIRDSAIAQGIIAAAGAEEDELRLVRVNLTDRTASYVVGLGRAYRKGGPGNVGDVWGGVLVRNSGVGFASLLMTMHLTRLLCKNGMVAPLPDALLARKRHRGIDQADLNHLLAEKLGGIKGRILQGQRRLELSEHVKVADVEGTFRTFLGDARLPQRLLPRILTAYAREPLPSAFGVSQAVTLAAQELSPEERLDLEAAAGQYLATVVVDA